MRNIRSEGKPSLKLERGGHVIATAKAVRHGRTFKVTVRTKAGRGKLKLLVSVPGHTATVARLKQQVA